LELLSVTIVVVTQLLGLPYLLEHELFVLLESFVQSVAARLRQEFGPSIDEWLNNDLNITELELERVACCAVEKRRDFVAKLFLDITLLEVLLHLETNPLEVSDTVLHRMAMVARVQAHVQYHLLVIERVLGELLLLHATFEIHDHLEVVGQVGRENHLNDKLSHVPKLGLGK
jgi:hypothetical protein